MRATILAAGLLLLLVGCQREKSARDMSDRELQATIDRDMQQVGNGHDAASMERLKRVVASDAVNEADRRQRERLRKAGLVTQADRVNAAKAQEQQYEAKARAIEAAAGKDE